MGYKAAKTELKDAIAKAKKDKWEELRNDMNKNPWGLGYKTEDVKTSCAAWRKLIEKITSRDQ